MFALFDLNRLITYTQQYTKKIDSLKLSNYAYEDTVDRSLLCLNFTLANGRLFLWHREFEHNPTYYWLPWFPDKNVVLMCIDPTGTWMVCLCSDQHLYVVCVRTLLEPGAKVDQLWRVDDVTQICEVPSTTGSVCCMTWWKTMYGENVLILATKVGFLLFIDMLSHKVLLHVDINEHIVDLQLLHSDDFTDTYLLVSTKSNNQWRILLEEKIQLDLSIIQETAYFPIQSQYKTIFSYGKSIDECPDIFHPKRFFQFPSHIQLSPQQARGRCFIAAHDLSSNIYKIYGSGLEQGVMFMYKLPVEVDNVLYTDKLLFTSSLTDHAQLRILANQFAEVSGNDMQDFPLNGFVQTFDLDTDERILCMFKKSFPHYWHDKENITSKESSDDKSPRQQEHVDVTSQNVKFQSHTVFDGCIVITNKCVYECKPRISPERLYSSMCSQNASVEKLETLAILTGVDLSYITLQVAEQKLNCKQYGYAKKLLNLAQCSRVQRCLLYAKYNLLDGAISLGEDLLHSDESMNTAVKKTVVDVCVKSCILQMLRSNRPEHHVNILRDLLLSQSNDLDSNIWSYLHGNNLYDVMWSVAGASGQIQQVVELYIHNRCLTLNSTITANLDSSHTKWIRKHKGSLLDYLTGKDVITLIKTNPMSLTQLFDLIEEELNNLEYDELYLLSEILNPAQICINRYLDAILRHKDIVGSSAVWEKAVDLTMLFVLSRIHLGNEVQTMDAKSLEVPFIEEVSEKSVLRCRENVIGCSTHLTAVVVDKKLYVWGRTGTSSMVKDSSCTEVQLPGNAVVMSISCGYTHILVLTNYGVYSLGSNKYGELGHGDRHISEEPRLIDRLKEECIVQLTSGQYHNMVLTEDGRVFTWGWGAHGQLGQGHVDDVLLPQEITSIIGHFIVNISAGQAHSILLTQKGDVYTFGSNAFGQLGLGDVLKRSVPTRVDISGPVKMVATQYFHSITVTNDNQLYQFGISPAGLKQRITTAKRIGRAGGEQAKNPNRHLVPTHVNRGSLSKDITIDQVSCGVDFTMVLTSSGSVYSWGRNVDGQLGIGTKHTKDEVKLVPLVKMSSVLIQQITCGPDFVVAMDTQGEVWGWGRNDYRQLGVVIPDRPSMTELSFVFPVPIPVTPAGNAPGYKELWEIIPCPNDRLQLQQLCSHGYHNQGVCLPLVVYLKSLSKFINLHLLLCKALQLGNYFCAAVICDLEKRPCDAFMYRLKCFDNVGRLIEDVSVMFTKCLRLLRNFKEKSELQHKVVKQLIDWWLKQRDLSVIDLEAVLTPHFNELAVILFTMISRMEQSNVTTVMFSPTFILQVSNSVLHSIRQGSRSYHILTKFKTEAMTSPSHRELTFGAEKAWHEMIGNVDVSEPVELTGKQMSEPVELTGKQMKQLNNIVNENNNSDKNKSLLDVHNTDKNEENESERNQETRSGMDVDKNTINADTDLDPVGCTDDKGSKVNNRSSIYRPVVLPTETVILFSCGHPVVKSVFKDCIMKEVDYRDIMYTYYTKPGGEHCKLACPSCVLSVLKDIQTQNEAKV